MDDGRTLWDFAHLSPTGITIAPDIPFALYEELGEYLHTTMDACQWALGGWAAHGESLFGDDWTRAVSPDRSRRVEQAAWVHKKVPPKNRHENLTYSHHRAVAGIEDLDVQARLLDMAEANRWQVATLAAAVKRAKETNGEDLLPWKAVEPETATRIFGTPGVKMSSTPSNDATNQIEKSNAPQFRVVGGTDHKPPVAAYLDYYVELLSAARRAIRNDEITDELRKAVALIDELEANSKRNVS